MKVCLSVVIYGNRGFGYYLLNYCHYLYQVMPPQARQVQRGRPLAVHGRASSQAVVTPDRPSRVVHVYLL